MPSSPIKIRELGHAVLYVRSLEVSSAFYRDLLGFPEITHSPGAAAFSGGRTHHELLLIEVGGEKSARNFGNPGLYHLGFKIGETDDDLRTAKEALEAAHVTILGSADHAVTHSLYVLDPDGNELEFYVDSSDEWKENPQVIMAPVKPLNI